MIQLSGNGPRFLLYGILELCLVLRKRPMVGAGGGLERQALDQRAADLVGAGGGLERRPRIRGRQIWDSRS